MKTLLRAVFAVALTATLAAAVAVPSDAAPRHARAVRGGTHSFDGEWSVSISTSYGNCGSYRAGVRISGGRVYSSGGDFNAAGSVNASGGISVRVSSSQGSAYGSGGCVVRRAADAGAPPAVNAAAAGTPQGAATNNGLAARPSRPR